VQAVRRPVGALLASVHADEEVCSVDPIDKRPALLEAIASLGKGDVLIVAKRDRFARDPIVVAMIEAAIIKARTKAALAVKNGRGEKTGGAIPYGSMRGPDRLGSNGKAVRPWSTAQRSKRS